MLHIQILPTCLRIDGWGGMRNADEIRSSHIPKVYVQPVVAGAFVKSQSSKKSGRISRQARSIGRRVQVSCVLVKEGNKN